MQRITLNFAGTTRTETLNGKQYLVAPITLLNEGVLNGSNGSLYYPSTEIGKNVLAWNYMPIVVNHPSDGSARRPEVIDRSGIGYVFNARMVKGSLVADGYFDVEAMRRVDSRVLSDLEGGRTIELSTGLFTTNHATRNGNFRGQRFTHVARDYRPDHLAILPESKGACSRDVGCGVFVASNSKRGTAPMCSHKPATRIDATELLDLPVMNFGESPEVNDRPTVGHFSQPKPVGNARATMDQNDVLPTPRMVF